ncbi:hypothetical protein N5D61_24760 [Pseudomonas sp. GD03842]|uniref:hypothetical protein n=1 Tax=Pseudomonas sp. GD03842 TaxID=2975385 RepID=UPI0024470B1A|nr:hypothetical protein [Pseudomonas sp. GD03842]MDH0749541.1 hypothetical protein [Pseudomonas sp. GD03842]
MNWSDIGNMVGKAAPVVGTLLGGPAGAAVGALVASALNVPNDPESVSAVLASNPDAFAKVQELQLNAKVQLQQLAVTAENNRLQAEATQYAAEAADRDSARKLAASQPRDFVRPALTVLMLAGSLFIIVSIMTGWALDVVTNTTAALTVGNVMGAWFMMTKEVMGFWFGMTKESQKQSAVITDFAVTPGSVTKPDK